MPHHVYHVRAVVIRGANRGESDRSYHLLTDHLGLINVYVRGVRSESSRLRYILQPLSFIEASLVRGREVWRLTTANPIFLSSQTLSPSGKKTLSRLLKILPHFLEDGAHIPQLWTEVDLLHKALREYPERTEDAEVIGLVRTLYSLGYWSGNTKGISTALGVPYGEIPVLQSETRKKYIHEINTILRST